MDRLQRKLQRLKDFDYGQNGIYFITTCTHNKQCLFGTVNENGVDLNHAGKMVNEKFVEGSTYYTDVIVEHYVVMPNHLHALISIHGNGTTRRSFPTTISEYMQRFKTLTTKFYIDGVKAGIYPPFDGKIWQKSFYDHIIRDEIDLQTHWDYIDGNPYRWMDDKYFSKL